jgi:hypothetical protein
MFIKPLPIRAEQKEYKFNHSEDSLFVYNKTVECGICQSFIEEDKYIHPTCKQAFHMRCLSSWRVTNPSKMNTCPLCQQEYGFKYDMIRCFFCNKIYINDDKDKHYEVCNKTCWKCDQKVHPDKIRQHIEECWKCILCNKKVTNVTELATHGEGRCAKICDFCGEIMTTRARIANHMKSHMINCEYCKCGYYPNAVSNHGDGICGVECDICGEKTPDIKKHKEVHLVGCVYCKKTHMINEGRHGIELCSKVCYECNIVLSIIEFDRHSMAHEFKCKHCDSLGGTCCRLCLVCEQPVKKDNLHEHYVSHNLNCEHCGIFIDYESTYFMHVANRYDCHLCDFKACVLNSAPNAQARLFNKHIMSHKLSCDVCDKTITTLELRNVHITRRPFDCNKCGKQFCLLRDLSKHLRRCDS